MNKARSTWRAQPLAGGCRAPPAATASRTAAPAPPHSALSAPWLLPRAKVVLVMLGGWVGAGPRAPLSQLRSSTRAPSPRAARATPTTCPTHDPRGPLGGGGQRHSHCWTQRDRPAPTPPGRLPAGPAPQICAGGVPGCGPWRAAARAWMRRCWASFPPAMNRTPAFTRLFWRGFPKLDSEFCSRPRGAGRG